MRGMFAAIAVFAIYLLFRGHNLPGGGFVAGLTFAVGIILQYMAGGTRWIEERLDIRPVRLIGIGLAARGSDGRRRVAVRASVPHVAHRPRRRCR